MTSPAIPPERIDSGPAILRRWQRSDLDAVYEALLETREHLMPWLPWAAEVSREGQREFLEQAVLNWESGEVFGYAMTVGGLIAGSAGLHRRSGPGGLEIGYWVHAAHTRHGLASAAAAALTDAAFGLPDTERVEIVVNEKNVASLGVPRKLGFEIAGRREARWKPSGGSATDVIWQLTREQWAARAQDGRKRRLATP